LTDVGGELLSGALDLRRAFGNFDLAGVLGRGDRDTEGQNHR